MMGRFLRSFMSTAALLVSGLMTGGLSNAGSSEDLAAAEDRLLEAWTALPLGFRTAVLVDGAPGGYGMYRQKEPGRYLSGEPVVVYAEPYGYGWIENADGTFTFGFDVDLLLKTARGDVIADQDNFQRLALTSRARNREFMLTITLTIDGAPPGDYVVEYRTRDIASPKEGAFSLPFSITPR